MLRALKDDPLALEATGKSVFRYKVEVMTLSAALAGAAGYASVVSTARADRFLALLRGELATATRPVLIRCLLSEPDESGGAAGLRALDLPEHAQRFRATFGATSPMSRSA